MLPHARGDDGVALGHLVQHLDGVLRLDDLALRLRVAHGELGLHALELRAPRRVVERHLLLLDHPVQLVQRRLAAGPAAASAPPPHPYNTPGCQDGALSSYRMDCCSWCKSP
jgi:hypothetical protein